MAAPSARHSSASAPAIPRRCASRARTARPPAPGDPATCGARLPRRSSSAPSGVGRYEYVAYRTIGGDA
eukprot:4299769-Pyramimonas_sp.AAC.2